MIDCRNTWSIGTRRALKATTMPTVMMGKAKSRSRAFTNCVDEKKKMILKRLVLIDGVGPMKRRTGDQDSGNGFAGGGCCFA
jgi:hypothetical protein